MFPRHGFDNLDRMVVMASGVAAANAAKQAQEMNALLARQNELFAQEQFRQETIIQNRRSIFEINKELDRLEQMIEQYPQRAYLLLYQQRESVYQKRYDPEQFTEWRDIDYARYTRNRFEYLLQESRRRIDPDKFIGFDQYNNYLYSIRILKYAILDMEKQQLFIEIREYKKNVEPEHLRVDRFNRFWGIALFFLAIVSMVLVTYIYPPYSGIEYYLGLGTAAVFAYVIIRRKDGFIYEIVERDLHGIEKSCQNPMVSKEGREWIDAQFGHHPGIQELLETGQNWEKFMEDLMVEAYDYRIVPVKLRSTYHPEKLSPRAIATLKQNPSKYSYSSWIIN